MKNSSRRYVSSAVVRWRINVRILVAGMPPCWLPFAQP